jgi:hypothetical protein
MGSIFFFLGWILGWFGGVPFSDHFCRLYELLENCFLSVAKMYMLGWGVGGDA